jgi:hypothetical protein
MQTMLMNVRYHIGTTELKQAATRTPPLDLEVSAKSRSSGAQGVPEKFTSVQSNMVHNHPSGDPTPSKDDIAMTREVKEAADKLGIVLHDHIIVGRRGHASFKALGLI